MHTWLQDLRYSFRQMKRNPGFAWTVIAILGLGIGATTAIFSAINPILFEPLPYPHASRLMMIWDAAQDGSRMPPTFHTYREVAERSRAFELTAVMNAWQPTLTGMERPQRLRGQKVTSSYFRVLGVAPAMGRDLEASDDILNGPKVVILSNRIWRANFNSDAGIVGRAIKLDDDSYNVIGVMPSSFDNVLEPAADFWSPLQYDTGNIVSQQTREWGHHLRMVGRLRPNARVDQATSELAAIARHRIPEFPRAPWAALENGFVVNSLQDDVAADVKPALLAVSGAVALLLLIACVNVTNLLLIRSAQREGEFAMRAALGAERVRIARQLITESLLLAFLGGGLGLVIANYALKGIIALSPPDLPRVDAMQLNGAAFAFAFGIASVVGVLVGMIPARHASALNLHINVEKNSERSSGASPVTRRVLVIAEVAVALVLLVGAGLLLRSMQRLLAIDPGFDPSQTISLQVEASGHRYEERAARQQLFEQALAAVRRVPGVTSAAFTSQLPLSGDYDTFGIKFASDANDTASPGFRYAVTPGYFETMRIRLRRGRFLDEHDIAGEPTAVVISESLSRRKFPSQDPIGQRVRIGPDIGRADRPWGIVVGVVGDVKQDSLALNDSDAVYTSMAQWLWVENVQSLVVRMSGDVASRAPEIRDAVWSVDKDEPIMRVATMSSLVQRSEDKRHFVLVLFEIFGIVALLLAATGIYGILSAHVAQRVREIGVRIALGASRRDVLALILRQGMMLAGVGIVIGIAGAAAATSALVTLLFGISRLDPGTYAGVILMVGCIAAVACGLPAWRAAQVDPAASLRSE